MGSQFPARSSGSREMQGFDPLRDLHRQMNRLFDDFVSGTGGALGGAFGGSLGGSLGGGLGTMPRIDVREDDKELCVLAEVPGVKPSEVDVRIDGDMLTISGEKRIEADRKEEDYQVMERGYGRFRRSIQLPYAPDPDQVRAECEHGLLTVHLPRQAQAERTRRIEVRGGDEAAPRLQGSEAGAQQPAAGQQGRSETPPGAAHH